MAFFVQDTRALWELYPFSPIHTPYFLSCAHTCTHRLPFTFLRWVIMRTWSNPFSITDRLHAFIFPIQSENVLLQIFSSTTSDRTMGVVLYNNAIVVHLPHPHLAASGCQPLWRSHQRSSSSHAFTDGWSGPMECLVAEWRAHLVATVLSLLPVIRKVLTSAQLEAMGISCLLGDQLFLVSGWVRPACFVDVEYLDFFFHACASISATLFAIVPTEFYTHIFPLSPPSPFLFSTLPGTGLLCSCSFFMSMTCSTV